MTSTGNPKHQALNYFGPTPPDRGAVVNVNGWKISTMTYRLLESRFGKPWADDDCRILARRPVDGTTQNGA